jgi:integrase
VANHVVTDCHLVAVRYTHTIIRKALADAVAWNLVPRNVADAANPPKQAKRTKKTWTADELRRFLEAVRDDRLYAVFLLAATTGMRRGEILGLAWSSLDLEASRLSVSRSLVSVDYKVQLSEPKTAQARRQIALDPATVAALHDHQARQLDERIAMGEGWGNELDLVFTREDGSPIHPQAFSEAFERHAAAAKLQASAHARDDRAARRRTPEGRFRAARPRVGRVHARHVHGRATGHAGDCGRSGSCTCARHR